MQNKVPTFTVIQKHPDVEQLLCDLLLEDKIAIKEYPTMVEQTDFIVRLGHKATAIQRLENHIVSLIDVKQKVKVLEKLGELKYPVLENGVLLEGYRNQGQFFADLSELCTQSRQREKSLSFAYRALIDPRKVKIYSQELTNFVEFNEYFDLAHYFVELSSRPHFPLKDRALPRGRDIYRSGYKKGRIFLDSDKDMDCKMWVAFTCYSASKQHALVEPKDSPQDYFGIRAVELFFKSNTHVDSCSFVYSQALDIAKKLSMDSALFFLEKLGEKHNPLAQMVHSLYYRTLGRSVREFAEKDVAIFREKITPHFEVLSH